MSLPLDDRSLYINRELSWLDFNARVLREALDPRTPLLERLKFHGIFATNLDEFYMVRVGGLRRKAAAGLAEPYADGLTPTDALDAIDRRVRELRETQTSQLRDMVLPELAGRDVRILHPDELTAEQWETLDDYFETQVYPVLTPLAVDPGHPFPYLSNLSLSLAVMLRDPERGDEHFARVKVPKSLSRWVPTSVPTHFVPLEEVIRANLDALFPGMIVVGAHLFRVTRYSDLDLSDGEHGDDLLAAIEEQVFRRRFGEVVRLEVQTGMPSHIRQLIVEELGADHEADAPGLTPRDIHEFDGLLELGDLITLAQLDLPDLRDPPFTPVVPRSLRTGGNFFEALRSNDLLVHHPFHSFTATVEDFIAQAARDPHVLAIKMTLYRTSGDTAIVRALLEAAERGKEVVVLVELKARFDEQNNIAWAKTLESYGIHVAYGSAALKTHAKTALVVRREAEGIRLYAHIGSGNYNTRSARVYTDVGLFTASPAIGADLRDLFNSLTGFVRERPYRRLLVAPTSLRAGILALIDREAEHARSGRGGRIIAKMNALVDEQIIRALYQASQAGVVVELIVRGICCLRPGVQGVSDNVRVISIVGRFLEHSRLWYFGNGGIGEYYLGSADWMPRNFDHRVEAVTPIDDRSLHPRLGALLQACLDDNRQAWDLGADGVWRQRHPNEGEPERSVHRILLGDPWGLAARSSPREQLAFWGASVPS